MATPVFVGQTSAGFAGSASTNVVSLTSLTGGAASAPATDDVVVVYYGAGTGGERMPVLGITGDNNGAYTLAASSNEHIDNNNARLSALYMVMGGTPDTQISASALASSVDGGAVNVEVWRGLDLLNVLDVTPTTSTGINGGRPDPPAITPVTDDAVVVSGGAGTTSTNTAFTSADLTDFLSAFGVGSAVGALVGVGHHAWSAGDGAFDPAAFGGGSTALVQSHASITLALRPAPTFALPTTGSLSITGQAPTVTRTASASPTNGALVLTGYTPAVTRTASAAPTTGVLSITGYAPTFTVSSSLAPAASALTLTGYTPSLLVSPSLMPANSALALIGLAPTFSFTADVAPTTGALTLTGHAPSLSFTGILAGRLCVTDEPQAVIAFTERAPSFTVVNL